MKLLKMPSWDTLVQTPSSLIKMTDEAQVESGRITLIKVDVSWDQISEIDLNRYMILAYKKRVKSFYKIGPRACTIKLFFLSLGAAR